MRPQLKNDRSFKLMFLHSEWFDPTKGFGFVVADLGGPDILLHANVLRNFGQGSVVDGSAIEILVQDTQRGLQATQVLSITPPQADTSVPLRDMMEFTPEGVRAQTLLSYGNASQPGSPHYGDQLDLFSRQEMRPAWRTRAEVEANLSRIAELGGGG